MSDNASIAAMEEGEINQDMEAAHGTMEPKTPVSTSNSGFSAGSHTRICEFLL